MDDDVLDFLKRCRFQIDEAVHLEGQLIPRDILLSPAVYEKVKPDITELKKKFSSSALTALQSSAPHGQKWPLLNLVRQILKACDYQMRPVRRSDGYDADGKKKYLRFFLVSKMKSIPTTKVQDAEKAE